MGNVSFNIGKSTRIGKRYRRWFILSAVFGKLFRNHLQCENNCSPIAPTTEEHSKYFVNFTYTSTPTIRIAWLIFLCDFRRDIVNVSEVAVIRIYHGQSETVLYKQTPAIQWFEIISKSIEFRKQICFIKCH